YAKVQEKLGHAKKMIESLEKAVELDPIPQTLTIFADALERTGEVERAAKVREHVARLVQKSQPKRVKQPRRVIM
ncbi:hypothetical protein GW746_01020, partial [Candidatus Saccharibacteria bacterium]|nr:hypothetical protein [Candidatus Saccharibacteria bacterium]